MHCIKVVVVVVLFSPKLFASSARPPFPLNMFYWTVPILIQVEHFL